MVRHDRTLATVAHSYYVSANTAGFCPFNNSSPRNLPVDSAEVTSTPWQQNVPSAGASPLL